jgi:hypothetical protein
MRTVEKRKHSRLAPPPNTFAALGRNYTRIGKVKDISLEGLAFEYIAGESTDSNSDNVDIFLFGNVFHLPNLFCKIVYDIQLYVPHVNNNLIETLTTKRCGIQFENLSEEDVVQLKLFLEAHSEGMPIYLSNNLSGQD